MRLIWVVVATAVGVLVAAGLAPFALQGSDGLRGLGFACSDTDVSAGCALGRPPVSVNKVVTPAASTRHE